MAKNIKKDPIKPSVKKAKKVSPLKEYTKTLAELKNEIKAAQIRAMFAVNTELVRLYWQIGKTIVGKQEQSDWGTSNTEKFIADLQNAFPGIEGFSKRNVLRMRAFYLAYEKASQTVAQLDDLPVFCIPWGHNVLILEKVKNTEERLWYTQKTIEQGWSRTMLETWVKSDLYSREGKAVSQGGRNT
jgi:predicted nuclease of restriction endonuclease-like (RecB) superfamily